MTLLLDLPVTQGLGRKLAQPEPDLNRFEEEAVAFHERVRTAYHELAASDPERWHCFDASRPPEDVAEDIWRLVSARLGLTS
jgi:dTMP kinase